MQKPATHPALQGLPRRYPSGRKIALAPRETEAQIKSVVIWQRVRLELSDNPLDQKHAFAFGRFCLLHKIRDELFSAGVAYADTVHRAKVAKGFLSSGFEPTDGAPMSDAELKENVMVTQTKWDNARSCLVAVSFSCACACEALLLDDRDAGIYQTDLIKNGLLKLAKHFGHLRSFHNI